MIITSDTLIPIEEHFRISAGPGAGKTYWLVKHIRNIQRHSTRLLSSRNIACITYTNKGVESILTNLGTESNQVEVSTIHSFLYRNLLKPYCAFIAHEYGLNVENLSGHEEPFVDRSIVRQWLENHSRRNDLKHPNSIKQLLHRNYGALKKWLQSIDYGFNKFENLEIFADSFSFYDGPDGKRVLSKECIQILRTDLLEYKRLYWKQGKLAHNDVLFFSYQLIDKYPFLLDVIRATFPYFLIDEFQDSNPIQVELVRKISEKEVVIGVIGDPAQAIYEFQGAEARQFSDFMVTGIREYTIDNNRRSTKSIIKILNSIRKDIEQAEYRDVEGERPVLIVGETQKAYDMASNICVDQDLYALYRTNYVANAMKEQFERTESSWHKLTMFEQVDSNNRGRTILSCIKAVELAQAKQFDRAIRILESLELDETNPLKHEIKVLELLYILVNNYGAYYYEPLITFYDLVRTRVNLKPATFRKSSNPEGFYKNNTYQELALCIENNHQQSLHSTVHKAKGGEFDNVFVALEREEYLDFLLNPNLENNEEHRIYYVAISRAKERLFISVPRLSSGNSTLLSDFFSIYRVE